MLACHLQVDTSPTSTQTLVLDKIHMTLLNVSDYVLLVFNIDIGSNLSCLNASLDHTYVVARKPLIPEKN